METAGSGARGTQRFVVTDAERQVADLLPVEVAPELARATVQAVPFWFHTFALNRAEGIYTPGAARDHRYRVAMLPADFAGARVLDVGTFDGFYAFLAERRGGRAGAGGGQRAVPAVGRFTLGNQAGGRGGFSRDPSLAGLEGRVSADGRAVARQSRRALRVRVLLRHSPSGGEPAGAVVRAAWTDGQRRYGADRDLRAWPGAAGRCRDSSAQPGEVYARDEFVYWAFGDAGLERLARIAGFSEVGPFHSVQVAGHPRIIGRLVA